MVPIPTTDAPHVMEIFRVHADEMIIESIISPRQQDCPLSYRVNAMTQECLPSRRIDRISYTASNFVRCRCRGSNEEICLLTGLFGYIPKNKLRNGASTNIAVTVVKLLFWWFRVVCISSAVFMTTDSVFSSPMVTVPP